VEERRQVQRHAHVWLAAAELAATDTSKKQSTASPLGYAAGLHRLESTTLIRYAFYCAQPKRDDALRVWITPVGGSLSTLVCELSKFHLSIGNTTMPESQNTLGKLDRFLNKSFVNTQ
jgi:hypothetical protein